MIDLHYWPTPNGWKISIMLEECALPYKIVPVNIGTGEQFKPEFLKISPNNRMPAIVDHEPAGGGSPISVFESGAILQYLAEKTGQFMTTDPARRWHAIQWLHFQMGGVGPMFGQVGFFHKFAGKDFDDKRPRDRYAAESKRLLGVMDAHLSTHRWFAGDEYTIADISMLGWVRNLIGFYGARELVAFDRFRHVAAWLERGLARPAVQRGLTIPARS